MKPEAPHTPKPEHDRQAKAEAERAQAALDNVREGYGDTNPLSPERAVPDPTPHGQRPAKQREHGQGGDSSRD
jgi:hypothetical protein